MHPQWWNMGLETCMSRAPGTDKRWLRASSKFFLFFFLLLLMFIIQVLRTTPPNHDRAEMRMERAQWLTRMNRAQTTVLYRSLCPRYVSLLIFLNLRFFIINNDDDGGRERYASRVLGPKRWYTVVWAPGKFFSVTPLLDFIFILLQPFYLLNDNCG